MSCSYHGGAGAGRDNPILQGAIADTGNETFKVEIAGETGAFGKDEVRFPGRMVPELALVNIDVACGRPAANTKPFGELQDGGISMSNAGSLDYPR